jgi:Spy/CpxP family protein refolding chaperone
MKSLKTTFLVSLIFFGIVTCSAQYGGMYGGGMNGGMYGGGMNRMGNQQSMQNTNNFGRNKSPEDIEKERVENLNKSIDKITKELNLDDLQVIVIRKEIEASSKSIYAVSKSEISNEDKIKEIDAINEKADRTINTYLNPEQKIKYKKYVDDRKERMEKYRMSTRN